MKLTRFFTNLYYLGLDTCELIAVNYQVVIQGNRITSTPDLVCISAAGINSGSLAARIRAIINNNDLSRPHQSF